ncbi:MAG: hypothetical protein ACREPR_08415, partial [Brasilonema sp.]
YKAANFLGDNASAIFPLAPQFFVGISPTPLGASYRSTGKYSTASRRANPAAAVSRTTSSFRRS